MSLIIQKAWFTRRDIQNNPNTLYVWGDNLARIGGANNPKSGQAFACRGEPNAVGIPTKKYPSMNESSFFTDDDYDLVKPLIDEAIERVGNHLLSGGDVVWPWDGIGTGRAELNVRAPKIWTYLSQQLTVLCTLDGVLIYD